MEEQDIYKEGNLFVIKKEIEGKMITFGSFDTLEEAIIERDELEEYGWPYLPEEPEEKPTEEDYGQYISKRDGKFVVSRVIRGEEKIFGEFLSLELAKEYSDYYIIHEEKIDNPNYIPKLNEQIELSFKFNLSSGAKIFTNIPNDLKNKISNLALSVSNLLDITFASIDIVYTEENELIVIEANNGVTMNNYILQSKNGEQIAYNIYKDAIKLMFQK